MRKRPPPFAMVLSALVAAAAVAIVLVGRAPSHQPGSSRPPTIGIGSTRACVTTTAEAQSDDRSAIVITASAEAPLQVTEQASGPRGIVTVTRSEIVTARVKADEPVEVKRTSGARARACANADSTTAARTAALRVAYARALAAAHALAAKQAAQALTAALHNRYPSVLAQTRNQAAARARRLALSAEPSLAARAQAEARSRAGG